MQPSSSLNYHSAFKDSFRSPHFSKALLNLWIVSDRGCLLSTQVTWVSLDGLNFWPSLHDHLSTSEIYDR